MDIKLELIAVPVTDVDVAKEFYVRAGFNADHDHAVSDDVRFVQLTPPGSACSICIGRGLTQMTPGSLDNMQAVVAAAMMPHTPLLPRWSHSPRSHPSPSKPPPSRRRRRPAIRR